MGRYSRISLDAFADNHKELQTRDSSPKYAGIFGGVRISDTVDFAERISSVMTHKQFLYVSAYYLEGKTLQEIADIFDVNKSTISRTIKRGLTNVRKAAAFLK